MQFILLKILHFYERNASLISSGDGSLPILGLHPLLPKPSQIWTLRRGFHFRKCNAMLPVSGTSTIFHPGRRKFSPYIFLPPPPQFRISFAPMLLLSYRMIYFRDRESWIFPTLPPNFSPGLC